MRIHIYTAHDFGTQQSQLFSAQRVFVSSFRSHRGNDARKSDLLILDSMFPQLRAPKERFCSESLVFGAFCRLYLRPSSVWISVDVVHRMTNFYLTWIPSSYACHRRNELFPLQLYFGEFLFFLQSFISHIFYMIFSSSSTLFAMRAAIQIHQSFHIFIISLLFFFLFFAIIFSFVVFCLLPSQCHQKKINTITPWERPKKSSSASVGVSRKTDKMRISKIWFQLAERQRVDFRCCNGKFHHCRQSVREFSSTDNDLYARVGSHRPSSWERREEIREKISHSAGGKHRKNSVWDEDSLSSLAIPYTKAKESHSYKQCFSTPHAVATEFMIQNIYQPEVHIFYYTADTRHSVEGRWEVMRETVK